MLPLKIVEDVRISIIHGLSVALRVVEKNKRSVSRNRTWELGLRLFLDDVVVDLLLRVRE